METGVAALSNFQFSFIVGGSDEHAALQAPGFNQRGIDHGGGVPDEKLLKGHRREHGRTLRFL